MTVRSFWLAFARPAKKLTDGMKLSFADDFEAYVLGRTEDGQVQLGFPYNAAALFDKLRAHGHMPLPPYIARGDTAEDKADYQTIYAAHDGSVAAPTAGLHFTPELMAALEHRGIKTAFVTLHVGAGTFQPVKTENLAEHQMHSEWYDVPLATQQAISDCRARGGRIVAVGTTTLRALESAARQAGAGQTLAPCTGDTDIFITPGFEFRVVDQLVTNFHLPKSTLMMLVSALAGHAQVMALYRHAVESRYRFFSYGDSMLLARRAG